MNLKRVVLLASLLGLGSFNSCNGNTPAEEEHKQPSDRPDTNTDTDQNSDEKDEPTDTDIEDDEPIPEPEDNIIENGSFEKWNDVEIVSKKNTDTFTEIVSMPEKWNGEKSNAYNGNINATDNALFVYDYTSSAHDGSHALQMVREHSKIQRFTTQPKIIWKGDYKCTAWVRGVGEIRLGYAVNNNISADYYSQPEEITSPEQWKLIRHNFKISQKKYGDFEFVLAAANTEGEDAIQVDDIVCTRKAMPCDTKNCEAWQICQDVSDTEAKCIAKNNYCEDDKDCGVAYKSCNANHECVVKDGMCGNNSDCTGGQICNKESNSCYTGNYCDSYSCPFTFQTCDNDKKACVINAGNCLTSADCTSDPTKPVCDVKQNLCVGVDNSVNVLTYTDENSKTYVMGAFEETENKATYFDKDGEPKFFQDVPAGWFGLRGYYDFYFPENEIKPEHVSIYSGRAHSGNSSLQIKFAGQPVERLVSEVFYVQPGKQYTCTYYVSGKGQYRHRTYCRAWGKDTQYATVNSDTEWTQVKFTINSNSTDCVIMLYGSNTEPEDHLLIDDLSCSLTFAD